MSSIAAETSSTLSTLLTSSTSSQMTFVSTLNPLAVPFLLTPPMNYKAKDFVTGSPARFIRCELNPFAQEFAPLQEKDAGNAVIKRLDPKASLFYRGQGSHFTKSQLDEEYKNDSTHSKQEQGSALVQYVDLLSIALAPVAHAQPYASVTVAVPPNLLRAHIQTLQRQAPVPEYGLQLRQVLPVRPLLWLLLCVFRQHIHNAIDQLYSEVSSCENYSLSKEQKHFLEDCETADYSPIVPIMSEQPIRPPHRLLDDWDRDTIFPEDEEGPSKCLDSSAKLSVLLEELQNLGPVCGFQHGESHPSPQETKFGPSEQQLKLESTTAQHNKDELPQNSAELYHHLSFLGYAAPCKSDTDPSLSLAIINMMPKGALSYRDDMDSLRVPVTIQQAFLFIDPVVYFEDHATIKGLSANQIREVTVGQVSKFYQGYGTWVDDVYDPDEDSPLEDQGDSNYYPRCCTVYNGLMTGSEQPDQTAFNTAIEVAYNDDLTEWKAIRAARSKLFPLHSQAKSGFRPPKSSPLRHSYTPESTIEAEVEHEKALTLRNNILLRPTIKSWADLDEEEEEDNDVKQEFVEAIVQHPDEILESDITQASSDSTPFCAICWSDSPSKGSCKPIGKLKVQYFTIPAYVVGMLAHPVCVKRLTIKQSRDERLSGYQGLYAATKQPVVQEQSSLPTVCAPVEDVETPGLIGIVDDGYASQELEASEDRPTVNELEKQPWHEVEAMYDDAAKTVEQRLSDEDLFGDMTVADEYESLHKIRTPEISSSNVSSAMDSEELCPEDQENEGFSHVPSPDVKRIVSHPSTPFAVKTVQVIESPATPLKKTGSEPEDVPETPESVRKIVQNHRSWSDPFLGGFSKMTARQSYEPKAHLPRSEASWDLRNILEEVDEDKTKVQQSVAALTRIFEEDENVFDDIPEIVEQPKSLAEINAQYRAFNGTPEVGQKPLREEYSSEVIFAPLRTPTAVRTHLQRKSRVGTMPPIVSSPTIVEEMEEIAEPSIPPPPMVLSGSDSGSEIGEATIYPSYTLSSDLDRLPATTPTHPARPTSVTSNRGLLGHLLPRRLRSRILGDIISSPCDEEFSDLDEYYAHQPQKHMILPYEPSAHANIPIWTEAIILHPIAHVDDVPESASLPWQTDYTDPDITALPQFSTVVDASSRRGRLMASAKPERSWRRGASARFATLLRGDKDTRAEMSSKDTTSSIGTSSIDVSGIIGSARDQDGESKGVFSSIKSKIASTLRRRS
ncbi:hypothetical protein LTR64_003083 [Lithohypha guttulata]|uniref:uncharacterized protein n=1 Tax=Lithohypha guttulata TaxID=1690604 RepID=UPI00315C5060